MKELELYTKIDGQWSLFKAPPVRLLENFELLVDMLDLDKSLTIHLKTLLTEEEGEC